MQQKKGCNTLNPAHMSMSIKKCIAVLALQLLELNFDAQSYEFADPKKFLKLLPKQFVKKILRSKPV